MILFNLQSLGTVRYRRRFLNFWKIKFIQIFVKKNLGNFTLSWIFFNVLYFFLLETDEKIRLLGSRAFNSLSNDVCFSHLRQKLWEKIDFFYFNLISIVEKKVNANYVEFDFIMGTVLVIFSFFWTENVPCLPHARPPGPHICKKIYIGRRKKSFSENYVEFYFRVCTVLVIFSFF